MANPIHKTKHGYYVASFASGDFLFDEIDLPLIRAHTWHLGKRGYPATHIGGRTVVLHRLLFSDAQEYEIAAETCGYARISRTPSTRSAAAPTPAAISA